MPKLDEYQGKRLLREAGIPVAGGAAADTPDAAAEIAAGLGRPVVVKAQVQATGRFKAGGIKFADDADAARRAAHDLLGATIKGFLVEKVLVEERLDVEKEFYAGLIVNDSCRIKGPVLVFSTEGGVDVEDVAAKNPEKVCDMTVDLTVGIDEAALGAIFARLGVAPDTALLLSDAVMRLYGVFRKYDARSAEINPLVLCRDGKVYAADCRVVVDEASVFRHPELEIGYPRDIGRPPTALERLAWNIEEKDYRGIGYLVQMADGFGPGEGYVGFHGIGGGGAMLGADALIRHGLKLANYADTSGNPTASKVYRVIKLILSQPNIDGYVMMGPVIANQEQWHHAHALVRALREELPRRPAGFPVVILLAGNKEAESREILEKGLAGLPAQIELFGRTHVPLVDSVAERMAHLVGEFRRANPTAVRTAGADEATVRPEPVGGTGCGFPFRTGCVTIDEAKCRGCRSFACVKACSLFGAALFRIGDGVPELVGSTEESGKRCIEDLACELYCRSWGNGALSIALDPLACDEKERMEK